VRVFRRAFGTTPHQYLIRVRIEEAKARLASDRGSVTDVCLEVGFSSLGSFSALFAERVGCPPSAWRRRMWGVRQLPRSIRPAGNGMLSPVGGSSGRRNLSSERERSRR